MKDQLISLETAILAKEKGYNQNPYKTADAYGPTYTDGSDISLRSSALFNPDTNTAVAPTQSLLQKWLREEHKLFVIVGLSLEHKFYVTIYDRNYEYELDTIKNKLSLDSSFALYEEALEAGLTEALKLIP